MALPVDDTPSEAFQWGAGGARMTPEAIAAQRKAAADAKNGLDYAPIRSPWQGVAKVAQSLMGALDSREASNAEKANAADNAKMIAALWSQANGGTVPVAAGAPDGVTPAVLSAAPAVKDTTGKIYSNDEPSPLDPPSGADRDNMIRTVYGEAGNEPTAGQLAVANVIRTRAVDGGYGGDTPTAVVRAPNQFEPWNGGPARDRMLTLSPNDPKYQAISKVVDAAYGTGGRAPEDPTEGMTHFYSPGGQAALGRPAPAWAGGDSVTIGGHVFNSPDDAKPGVQVASTDPAQVPASPAVAKVSGALAGVNPAVLAAVTSPYASAATKQIAGAILQAQLSKEKKDTYSQQTDKDGNLYDVNNTTHERKMFKAAEKDPTSVQEYNFYKGQLPAGSPPMDYSTWSDHKARAAATNVSTNVDTRAESELSKTVGKAQGEVIGEDIKAGSHASSKLRQLATLDEANKSGGDDVSSGPFGKAILSGKQGLSELTGVDLKGVPESEVIQKVGFGLATNMVKAITNRPSQMEFGKALENVPGLLMSKQGRIAMTSILTQDARAEQEIGRLANKSENHKNWQEVKDQYYNDHPLMSPFTGKPFGADDIQMLTKAGGAAPAAAAAAAPVSTKEQYDALPAGSSYVAPDGSMRTKK